MKHFFTVIFTFFFLFLFGNLFIVQAISFPLSELESDQKDIEIERFNLQREYVLDLSDKIGMFSVNKDEMIALSLYDKSSINIYDKFEKYMYTYTFNEENRRAYSIEWENECLVIILWGEQKRAVKIDSTGNIVDIQNIPMSDAFNSYLNEVHNSTKKIINQNTYEMRNNMNGVLSHIPKHYTQLVKTDKIKNESIIFDNSKEESDKIVKGVVWLFLLLIIIGIFVPIWIKWKRGKER